MIINLQLSGTTPLMMHNSRLADPLDPITREIKKLTANRKKTDEIHRQIAELEFKGGLYINEQGPFIPGWNIKKWLIEGARISKLGKAVERGVIIPAESLEIPLLYDGPRSADQLWKQPLFVNRSQVVVTRQRVTRTRPIFSSWGLSLTVEIDEEILNLDSFATIARDAGAYGGLGDSRSMGRGRCVAKVARSAMRVA